MSPPPSRFTLVTPTLHLNIHTPSRTNLLLRVRMMMITSCRIDTRHFLMQDSLALGVVDFFGEIKCVGSGLSEAMLKVAVLKKSLPKKDPLREFFRMECECHFHPTRTDMGWKFPSQCVDDTQFVHSRCASTILFVCTFLRSHTCFQCFTCMRTHQNRDL